MKMTKTLKTTAAALVMGLTAAASFAIDGTEVMQKVYDRVKPDFSQASVQMTLTDKNGSKEVRNVGEYGRCKNNLSDAVMMFFSPASVKDTRFLQKENKGKDDDKWIYLPALRSTTRVASSDGGKPFVGTDFTYDDMSTREVEEDTHKLLGEEKKGNFDCYKVESTPVDKNDQYQFRISWVDKNTWLPVYIELYDKKGKLEKVSEIKSIKQYTGNRTYNVPMEQIMTNVQTGHSTSLKILNLTVDKPLADKIFTPNFLNTGRL
jgi:hypothetical protein